MQKYDVIIIGAGPSGIFCAYELIKENKDLKILMVEKGRPIEKRMCPKRTTKQCVGCQPCAITTGFAGAGAFSDGKLSLSPDVGGNLPDILGYDKAVELIKESDDIYLKFGADTNVYGVDKEAEIREIRRRAITANLKLIECPIRHLGTEEGYKIYTRLQEHLLASGVEMLFNTMVQDILIENQKAKGIVTTNGDTYYANEIVAAIGREGSDWFSQICMEHGIETKVGTVDIGVRVEVRDEVMEFLNKNLYEAKLVYYTPTFDDKVRTFCTNPSGEVATEYYENNLAVVNGHAYKSKDYKTNNTNFAILVSKNFTKPFKTPIEYGKHIAQLSNMLCGGRILVQTFGDFQRGRRTTEERLCRNNLIPTLKDAIPGDLSLVFPHRIMVDIKEMILALDKVTPGIASDETLLYGVEVKFYSNKVVVNKDFETSVEGLRAIGDGAAVTRGLQQASANGISVARSILAKMK
ncbi:NAD(P)/FAD-dependent oxidoreductase [Lachnospiraceae bacterium MD1]|uniref:NAD(P)/FAD-dependent oxidoreductase n=1 Tax=Variimorphobacter saccharofermentans TaxID=2755051 RepID=A0A839JYD7_9FIRM|nr:NAD(P)/FAD-dependent oxidoreductase [Variimorphobacter saccharofermentans]MBB2182364.1 NAD(P)/FAD-dependent oxidoreductase [Variimorphobacter saccharofermentans]